MNRPSSRQNLSILNALPRAAQTPEKAAPARGPREAKAGWGLGWSLAVLFFGALACAIVAFPALYVGTSPAVELLSQQEPTATSVYSVRSVLPKPSLAPSPIAMSILPSAVPEPQLSATEVPGTDLPATDAPTLAPTETPGVAEVSILADTPVPTYAPVGSAPVPAYSGSKYILVDISEQHMYVYENETLLWSFVASTGMNNATRAGHFQVQSKIPNAYGATWNIWMPNWLGIYYAGGLENGIHALPILSNGARLWDGWLGTPISYGCVVLGVNESEMLYNWAEMGTPVEIQW